MTGIAENIEKVAERIDAAAIQAGRRPEEITLVCVSKTQPAESIEQAVNTGYRHIGESYLSESATKQQALSNHEIEWHFIGAIQSNKCKHIAQSFNWVHSVSSVKVAQRLNTYRPDNLPKLQCFLQINVDNESTKSGLPYEEVPEALDAISDLDRLELRGFMAIPRKRDDMREQLEVYRKLHAFLESMRESHRDLKLDCLSIGMSNDMESAIAAGATHVRVGSDIFGARVYSSMEARR